MKRATATTEFLTGWCSSAKLIEEGRMPTTGDPDELRAKCPIVIVGANGIAHRCSDPSHEGVDVSNICKTCGYKSDTGEVTDYACVETEECTARVRDRLMASPTYRLLQECREASERANVERNASRPGKAPGRCEHCGEATKGGRFRMGHDAKLKSQLMGSAREGSAADLAELLARKWVNEKWVAVEGLPEHQKVSALELAARGEDYIESRVLARIGTGE